MTTGSHGLLRKAGAGPLGTFLNSISNDEARSFNGAKTTDRIAAAVGLDAVTQRC